MFQKKVYILGGGPGNPDLLTIRAVNILKKADCILYDSLVNPEILELSSKACKKVFVGKRLDMHSVTQDKIHEYILSELELEKFVVRLKGGDPLIFGRTGEEIEFLNKVGILYEIIPGVTSASAAAAALGVSITHRIWGQSAIFLSGYKSGGTKEDGIPDYDWHFLARSSLTIIFYMGRYNLSKICECLLEHGKSPSTKIAIVSNCSLSSQKMVSTTLEKITELVIHERMEFPAIILIGSILNSSKIGISTNS